MAVTEMHSDQKLRCNLILLFLTAHIYQLLYSRSHCRMVSYCTASCSNCHLCAVKRVGVDITLFAINHSSNRMKANLVKQTLLLNNLIGSVSPECASAEVLIVCWAHFEGLSSVGLR